MSVSAPALNVESAFFAVSVSTMLVATGWLLLPAFDVVATFAVYVLSVAATATDAAISTTTAVPMKMIRRKLRLLYEAVVDDHEPAALMAVV